MTDRTAPHRVTVEFIAKHLPFVEDFATAEEAEEAIETAKRNPEAWHIFHSVQSAPGVPYVVRSSLYRSPWIQEWDRSVVSH